MLIFLDFDGVLHRTTRDRVPFEYLGAFETILRDNPNAQVVISSTWRELFSVEHMREGYFSDDIQPRIIGATPVIHGARKWQEIQAYLGQAQYAAPYVVVDDDPTEFPSEWEPLLLCASESGLDAGKQAELCARLGQKS